MFIALSESTALYLFLRSSTRSAGRGLAVLLVATILPFSVAAQDSAPSATVSGTIRGHDGKPVAQAQVELRKKDSPDRFTTNTDSGGTYKLPNLKDGVYSLDASKDGYAARVDALYLT